MRNFPRLWVITGLIIDIFISLGFTFGSGQNVQLAANYTNRLLRYNSTGNSLSKNFNSLLNKSKELEEELYSEYFGFKTSISDAQKSGKSSRGKKISKIPLFGTQINEWRNLSNSLGSENGNSSFKTEMKKFKTAVSNSGKNSFLSSTDDYFLGFGGHPFANLRVGHSRKFKSEKKTTDPRYKRSVLHLYNMVLCATGCNPFAYKGYGCYCGFLGSGYPVDGIDSCCRMHDRCYNTAGCPTFFEYFVPYFWKCHGTIPLCAIDHGSYGGPHSCAQRLCECDKQLALCLRRYPCPSGKALCTSSPFRFLQNVLTP